MLRRQTTKHILWSLLLYGSIWTNTWAQSPQDVIRKAADYYRSLQSFSVDVSVDFYATETSSSPERRLKGYTRIQGNLSHTLFDGRENIMGNDFILVVDYNNKSIYYSPREKTAKKISKGVEVLDSSFTKKYHIVVKADENGLSVFKLSPKSGSSEFASIMVKIDPKTNVLREITYLHNGNVKYRKSVIKYSNFNPRFLAGKDEFLESKFLVGKQKKATPSQTYSQYKLVNSYNYDPKQNLIE